LATAESISSSHSTLSANFFDTVYPEAQIGGSIFKNVQTTAVSTGGAVIVEFTADVPGTYVLVDHALARLDKGAWGAITVRGEERTDIFHGTSSAHETGH
jgi:nitrite reductase (NO-forming)